MPMFVDMILVGALYNHYSYYYQDGPQKATKETKEEREGRELGI